MHSFLPFVLSLAVCCTQRFMKWCAFENYIVCLTVWRSKNFEGDYSELIGTSWMFMSHKAMECYSVLPRLCHRSHYMYQQHRTCHESPPSTVSSVPFRLQYEHVPWIVYHLSDKSLYIHTVCTENDFKFTQHSTHYNAQWQQCWRSCMCGSNWQGI